MYVADAYGQKINAGFGDEPGGRIGVGGGAGVGWFVVGAERQFSQFRLDPDAVGVRQIGQVADPSGVLVKRGTGVSGHYEVEPGVNCFPDPIVMGTFVENDAAGHRG